MPIPIIRKHRKLIEEFISLFILEKNEQQFIEQSSKQSFMQSVVEIAVHKS